MAFCDFVVKYNPKTDTSRDLTKRILYSIIISRIKHKKPAVLFVCGDSGEGKSISSLALEYLLFEIQGIDLKDYVDDTNIYVPIEYPKKIRNLLGLNEGGFNATGLKKPNIICVHEARELIKAKLWHSFISQAIADVNAMSRSVKRLVFIIVSQFIRDITTDVRYTLNYYIKIVRPKGKKARAYINVMWKDDSDLEKPKLRKRKLSGYLVYPNGLRRRYVPQYLELTQPPREIVKEFEKGDLEAKSKILKRKLDKLIKEMETDLDIQEDKKIDLVVDFYIKNTENLNTIGKRRGDKWKVNKEFREMHDLTKDQCKEFEIKLNEQLTKKGVVDENFNSIQESSGKD
jgi:hypothetical protein